MDARGWGEFAGLDEHLTIIQLHPRGSGLSGSPADGSYFLSDYAGDLEALRQYLGLAKPALIGWSHGGMVVQEFASRYPDALSKLILYDTSAYFGEFLEDIEAAVKEFKDEPWYLESFEALQKEWAGEYETAEEMAALWSKEMKFYFKEFNQRAQRYQRETGGLPIRIESLKFFNEREAEEMDLRPRLSEIRVPVLIIVGRHDFITNVAMAEEMAAHLPDARLEIFENSGHFAHVEEPADFRRLVREFLVES
jgi:proline iminopeptidase